MNKKAFTLIELLAVIIIIGVIAVITIPKVRDSIDSSKKSVAQTSAYGYKKAINQYILEQEMNKNKIKLEGEYNVDNNGNLYNEEISYNLNNEGKKPKNGVLIYSQNELISGCLTIDKYKVTFENGEVINTEKGSCEYERMLTHEERQRLEDIKSLAASYIMSLEQSEYEGSGIIDISEITSYVNYSMEPPSGGWVSMLYNETNGITVFKYSLKYGANEVVTFDGTTQTTSNTIAPKPAIAVLSGVNGKTTGDEIAIGAEHFYVISSTSETTTLLAKANLNIGPRKNNNLTEGIQGEVGQKYGVLFSKEAFWISDNAETNYLNPEYRIGNTIYANVYDPLNYAGEPETNTYSIAYYVIAYKNYLNTNNTNLNVDARLVTQEEYAELKTSYNQILTSQTFYLGLGRASYNSSLNKITPMINTTDTSSSSVNTTVTAGTPGVRPVIEIATSKI